MFLFIDFFINYKLTFFFSFSLFLFSAGTYQDEHSQIASNVAAGCDVCKLGTYVTTVANDACLDCARGKYNDDDGKTKEAHNTDNGQVWTVGTCSDATQKTETDCTRAQKDWTIGTCSDTTQTTETDCTSANSCKVCVTVSKQHRARHCFSFLFLKVFFVVF